MPQSDLPDGQITCAAFALRVSPTAHSSTEIRLREKSEFAGRSSMFRAFKA
jgi:hypothetical protein